MTEPVQPNASTGVLGAPAERGRSRGRYSQRRRVSLLQSRLQHDIETYCAVAHVPDLLNGYSVQLTQDGDANPWFTRPSTNQRQPYGELPAITPSDEGFGEFAALASTRRARESAFIEIELNFCEHGLLLGTPLFGFDHLVEGTMSATQSRVELGA